MALTPSVPPAADERDVLTRYPESECLMAQPCFSVSSARSRRMIPAAVTSRGSTVGKFTNTLKYQSHAVSARRVEPADSADDFPTPPWATRALVEHVLDEKSSLATLTCLEPACGRGHMSRPLQSYFASVKSADAYDYGYSDVRDFLTYPYETNAVDWVITNPPFRLAEDFILRGLRVARKGVAILARTVFLESIGRYESIFSNSPPSKFAQFTERVPMVKGRLDPKASTATGYAWFVWEKDYSGLPRVMWVPPCRRKLERPGDYPEVGTRQSAASNIKLR